MPKTVQNQRLIAIHRTRATSDFLGIKNSHWQAAARDLGAHALMLYLYFASNADNFTLALSPTAIRQAVGMPASTFRDQLLKLIDKGYLVQRKDSNIYDFYEIPKRATHTTTDNAERSIDFTASAQEIAPVAHKEAAESREININNTNINKSVEKQVSPTPQFKF